jgi:hypothetical protein
MKDVVMFDVKVYSKGRKGFNFPMAKAEKLGYKRGKPFHVDLKIAALSAKYCDIPFESGTEIRKSEIFRSLESGNEIHVIARKSK